MKCECGCGVEILKGKKFVHGHNTRVKLPTHSFAVGSKPWNEGLTKEKDARLANQGEQHSLIMREKFASGEIVIWNKDITSSDNPNLLRPSNKNNFLKNGKPWNAGLNKKDNPDKVTYGCAKDRHWNWKGGKRGSKTFLTSAYGKEFVENADEEFRSNHGQCIFCGKDSGMFERNHVHHFLPFDPFGINARWNLMVICKEEHPKFERYCIRMFNSLFPFLKGNQQPSL